MKSFTRFNKIPSAVCVSLITEVILSVCSFCRTHVFVSPHQMHEDVLNHASRKRDHRNFGDFIVGFCGCHSSAGLSRR